MTHSHSHNMIPPPRRGRVEKALSLAVSLRAADACCDARWAARRRALPALEAEAAALAARYRPRTGRPHHYYHIWFKAT